MKVSSSIPIGSVVLIATLSAALAADVIDDSLRLRFNFDAAPVNNIVADTSLAAAHPGVNANAVWVANEDGRSGVMEFKAPSYDRITVPAIPAFNSSVGTISFWIKTSGELSGGDFAAMLFDRRTQQGDVITLTDDGVIFVQARAG